MQCNDGSEWLLLGKHDCIELGWIEELLDELVDTVVAQGVQQCSNSDHHNNTRKSIMNISDPVEHFRAGMKFVNRPEMDAAEMHFRSAALLDPCYSPAQKALHKIEQMHVWCSK